jgi:hypothetical protein
VIHVENIPTSPLVLPTDFDSALAWFDFQVLAFRVCFVRGTRTFNMAFRHEPTQADLNLWAARARVAFEREAVLA